MHIFSIHYGHIGGDRASGGTAIFYVEQCVFWPFSASNNATDNCCPYIIGGTHHYLQHIYVTQHSNTQSWFNEVSYFVTTPSSYSQWFNAEHILWGLDHIDNRCTIATDIFTWFILTLLNTGARTYFCVGFGTSSAPNLMFCSPLLCTLNVSFSLLIFTGMTITQLKFTLTHPIQRIPTIQIG